MRKSALLTASTALVVLLVYGVAWADTLAVRNTNDSGTGSLRAAIIEANASSGADVIVFGPSVRGTINLARALPALRTDVEIRGPGAGKLTVRRSAAEDFRVFAVQPRTTVTISGLRISNGIAIAFDPYIEEANEGGGIYNERGVLTVRDCVFSGNRASSGGDISNVGGRLTVVGSTFSANRENVGIVNKEARYDGGESDIVAAGRLTVRDSTFSANVEDGPTGAIFNSGSINVALVEDSTFSGYTDSAGGAISNYQSTMTISDSTFSKNEATRLAGGAVINDGSYGSKGSLTVRNSTFSENTARRSGGGIHTTESSETIVVGSTFSRNTARKGGGISNVGDLTLRNSTFFGNRAEDDGGGLYNTFGINFAGSVRIEGGTFANNSAARAGGGIYNNRQLDADNLSLRMTILSGNDAPDGPDASGEYSSGGYNLVRDPSGATGFGPTDLTNVRAGLDPRGPKDNGGPTPTIALVPDSPALDAVEEGCPPPDEDQRGVSRPQDGDGDGEAKCDVGAFERDAPPSP